MNKFDYLGKIMQLGFEVGRGNKNAFNEIFGEEPADEEMVREGFPEYEEDVAREILNEECKRACESRLIE